MFAKSSSFVFNLLQIFNTFYMDKSYRHVLGSVFDHYKHVQLIACHRVDHIYMYGHQA